MTWHDRQQSVSAVLGVTFAFLLIVQNIASLQYFIWLNSAYVHHSGADLWVVPPGTHILGIGSLLGTAAVGEAEVIPGVRWVEPVVTGTSAVRLSSGGSELISLVGARLPALRGGPFNIVMGTSEALFQPDTMIFEDDWREKWGGLNVGDTLEIGQHRVRVGGLSWGTRSILGPMTFGDYDVVKQILAIDSDRCSAALVGLEPSADPMLIRRELQARVPEAEVLTTEQLTERTRHFVLVDLGLGPLFASLVAIGVIVGVAIVGISMRSAVQQNIREFATLKAVGATHGELTSILLFQAFFFTLAGSFLGAALVCELSWVSRSASVNNVLQPALLLGAIPAVGMVCIIATLVSVRPLKTLEPSSVFR